MILLTHILIALASIVFATGALLKPSKKVLFGSYIAIVATLASGVYLTMSNPARLAQACISGIVYIAVVSTISVFAHKRLSSI